MRVCRSSWIRGALAVIAPATDIAATACVVGLGAMTAAIAVTPASAAAQSSAAPQPGGYTYYWPGECLQAVRRGRDYYWRARQDSVAWTIPGDTALSDEKKVARECVAHFANAQLTPRDLVPLAQLYLILGDESSARSNIERRLAEADVHDPGPRAWVLAQIVDGALSVSPKHLELAQTYLTQLEALRGDDAAVGKVKAYLALAEYYRDMGNDEAMVSASQHVVAAGRGLNAHDRIEFASDLLHAYDYMAEAEGDRTNDSVAPLAVVARARADLGQLPNVAEGLREMTEVFGLYGHPGARLVATAWVGPAGDTIHPMPGKVTLLDFIAYRWTLPAAGHMKQEFGEKLDLALVRPTIGYFKDLGPLSTADEVGYLRKYFTDELNAPGALAITETQFHRIPDGRRIPDPGPNDRAYQTGTGTSFVVLDKQGIIRRVWLYWDRPFEPRIEKTLKKYIQ